MPELPPLTHHEILTLIGPFTRRGRQLDLPASSLQQRQLVFRSRQLPAIDIAPAPTPGGAVALPALRETLRLDLSDAGVARLTRELVAADGLRAVLQAEGGCLERLLACVDAVPPQRQLHEGGGAAIALTHRLAIGDAGDVDAVAEWAAIAAAVGANRTGNAPALVLRAAEARLPGLTLQMTLTGVAGFPAEIELLRTEPAPPQCQQAQRPRQPHRQQRPNQPHQPLQLPADVLAVLGRAWTRLTPVQGASRSGWQGRIAVRGAGAERGRDAEARLHATVAHLLQTLAEPPARFHERHRAARWAVELRGLLPLAIAAGIVIAAVLLQRQGREHPSVLALLANLAPPVLLGLFFLRGEMPQIVLPGVPRRGTSGTWLPTARPLSATENLSGRCVAPSPVRRGLG